MVASFNKPVAPGRNRGWRAARFALFLALLGYMFYSLYQQKDAVSGVFSANALPWLGAATALSLLSNVICAWRQVVLLRDLGEHVSLWWAIRITFAGEFANNMLPAGTGTDLVRLFGFRGVGNGTAATYGGVILVDRILGLASLSVLAFCCIPPFILLHPGLGDAVGSLLAGAGVLLVGVALSVLAFRLDFVSRFIQQAAGRVIPSGIVSDVFSIFRQYLTRRDTLMLLGGLATLGHLVGMAVIGCIAYSVTPGMDAFSSFLISPIVFLAASIPVTPGNLGWTESLAESSWALFGLSNGMLIFLVRRFIVTLLSLPGSIAYKNIFNETRATNPGASTIPEDKS